MVSFLVMGMDFNVISAMITTGTVMLIIVDMLAFVGISLNAVSLVNLVIVSTPVAVRMSPSKY